MRLLELSIHNFGVYRGTHTFELAPVRDANQRASLTIIRGHNGSGKSTLFQACKLAFHGAHGIANRISGRQYDEYLLSRLQSQILDRSLSSPASHEAGVRLSFEYTRLEDHAPHRIQVERNWRRQGQRVRETLSVMEDGQPLGLDSSDYQAWLNDLFPPGLASICFFDAEQLEALANPDHHFRLLGSLMNRLLGIEESQRLHNDLEQFILRPGGAGRSERLRADIRERQSVIEGLETRLSHLQEQFDTFVAAQRELDAGLVQLERAYVAEGGGYAERRPMLLERRDAVKREIEDIEVQLRELTTGLLPFALAPDLCSQLQNRLLEEAYAERLQIAEEVWKERTEGLYATFAGEEFWQNVPLSLDERGTLARRLTDLLGSLVQRPASQRTHVLHPMAETERERMYKWIRQSLHDVPHQTDSLGERLRMLQAEERTIQRDLGRAPDDEALAALHTRMESIRLHLADVRRQINDVEAQVAIVRFQRDEQVRRREQAIEEMVAIESHEQQLLLAGRTRNLLRAYTELLTQQRIARLESAIVSCFNALCRKEHLLKCVAIDLSSHTVKLYGPDHQAIDLRDFSAGEQQLYALACLWALRQVSGREFPLVIDTPLARLDSVHRYQVICQFVPAVSDQVVLFATEAEFDDELLVHALPYLAHLYDLRHDAERNETQAEMHNAQDFQPTTLEQELVYRAEVVNDA